MPHQVAFSFANLSIFVCAVTNAPNSWHASLGEALRSPAAVMAAALFSVASRRLEEAGAHGCGFLFCVFAEFGEVCRARRLLLRRRRSELRLRAAGKKCNDAHDWQGPAQTHET